MLVHQSPYLPTCKTKANERAFAAEEPIVGKPAHLSANHELHQGVAPPGLTHLTYRWEREEVRGAREERCYALVCISNHPDLTANHLQSF